MSNLKVLLLEIDVVNLLSIIYSVKTKSSLEAGLQRSVSKVACDTKLHCKIRYCRVLYSGMVLRGRGRRDGGKVPLIST